MNPLPSELKAPTSVFFIVRKLLPGEDELLPVRPAVESPLLFVWLVPHIIREHESAGASVSVRAGTHLGAAHIEHQQALGRIVHEAKSLDPLRL